MLNDEQIDYLLQIKATTPPLQERTVRVMLNALRWSPEEIRHALLFLKKSPAPPSPSSPAAPAEAKLPLSVAEGSLQIPSPTISIKQNPFPIGSPLVPKAPKSKRWKHALHLGALLGLVVFLGGLILYARFVGV